MSGLRKPPVAPAAAPVVARPARPLAVAGLPHDALELRESLRASRLTLRVDPGRDVIQVVVPVGVSETEAARFVTRHADWIRTRLDAMPPRMPFAVGAVVPGPGCDHVIRRAGGFGGTTPLSAGEIRVGGEPDFTARRVRDFLIKESRDELARRARAKAAVINKR